MGSGSTLFKMEESHVTPEAYNRTKGVARALAEALGEVRRLKDVASGGSDTGGVALEAEGKENAMRDALARAESLLSDKLDTVAGELSYKASKLSKQSNLSKLLAQLQLAEQSARVRGQMPSSSDPTTKFIQGLVREHYHLQKPPERQNARTAGTALGRKKKEPVIRKLERPARQDGAPKEPPSLLSISDEELDKGVLNMMIRGVIPGHVDLGQAFSDDFFKAVGLMTYGPRHGYDDGIEQPDLAIPHGEGLDMALAPDGDEVGISMQAAPMQSRPNSVAKLSVKSMDAETLVMGEQPVKRRVLRRSLIQKEERNLNEEDAFFARYKHLKKPFTVAMETLKNLNYLPMLKYEFLKTMPAFRMYKAKNNMHWKAVQVNLPKLSEYCRKYRIVLAAIDGKRLISSVIRRKSGGLDETDIAACVVNLYEIFEHVNEFKSAEKIQSVARGYLTRKRYPRKEMVGAIWIIQSYIRRWLLRRRFKHAVLVKSSKRAEDTEIMQQEFKAQWRSQYSVGHRTIVHVPSFSVTQDQRVSTENFLTRQFGQLSRLCDLKNPMIHIVFISPFSIPDDLLGYFISIMNVRGVKNPKARLKVIVPENMNRLPAHFSLAKALLSSQKTIKRVELAIHGQRAYMVPHSTSHDEVELSLLLNIPILAPPLEVFQTFNIKSGARKLFQEADMNVPPGAPVTAFSTNPLREVSYKLMSLIKENPFVKKWILKIDHEFEGRGHAILDLQKIEAFKDAASRVEILYGQKMSKDSIYEAFEVLMENMPKATTIVRSEIYPTFDSFFKMLGYVGGVIEAYPEWMTGSPSVNLFIDPVGKISVQSTHESIYSPEFLFVAASFPQSSVPHRPLEDAARAIAKACFDRGIIGHVGIDFVASRQEGLLKLWAVDLNLHITKTQLTFQFFHFLSGGYFNPSTGVYSLPEDHHGARWSHDGASGDSALRRCYVMTDFITSSRFENLHLKGFFKDCRNWGIFYDLGDSTGTAFQVIDTLSTGILSIFSVGKTTVDAMKEANKTLSVLAKRFGQKQGGDKDNETFHRIYSTIRFIADKLRAPRLDEG